MLRYPCHARFPAALCLALSAAGCGTVPDAAPDAGSASGDQVPVEGTIVSIDTQPWTYDGNAIVLIDVPGRGPVSVHLPARWNLCKAPPVAVEALAAGMRVRATGASAGPDEVVVCERASHGIVPLR